MSGSSVSFTERYAELHPSERREPAPVVDEWWQCRPGRGKQSDHAGPAANVVDVQLPLYL
ncbi:hypothetical protein EV383_0211 [Pseudonocardia sediminis]|uniref:Uncharacterized protein n=1 Tax=Pseudonocardia sediminis TaxID=1397368 RepID=A0A4Q7URL9_PSEST|nr:hypothetical protein EV383_0211 [Pseudonocardia sediminis]